MFSYADSRLVIYCVADVRGAVGQLGGVLAQRGKGELDRGLKGWQEVAVFGFAHCAYHFHGFLSRMLLLLCQTPKVIITLNVELNYSLLHLFLHDF